MPRPNDVGVGTAILVFNHEGKLLLGKRKGAHRAGHWSCPGGWLDRPDKKTSDAVIRESMEEAGITVYDAFPHCWTTEDHPEMGVRTVTLYHMAHDRNWSGEPRVMEPDKCEEWAWFDLHALPEPLFPGIQEAVDLYLSRTVNANPEYA